MFLESSPNGNMTDFDKNSPAVKWFRQFNSQLSLNTPPKAILVISAHWETSHKVHISSQAQHTKLFYDYYGFPPEAYQIEFKPAGHFEVAKRVKMLLDQASIPAKLNDERNLDHGVFVPLKLIFPKAEIPVVSMSIFGSLSPAQHISIGKALALLRKKNVLTIGSGSTIHGCNISASQVDQFVDTLTGTLTKDDEQQREKVLLNWAEALPYAQTNHPFEEYLIPLHVIIGAADDDHGKILNPTVSKGQAVFGFGM